MNTKMQMRTLIVACVVIALLISLPLCSFAAQQQKNPREIMGQIFAAMARTASNERPRRKAARPGKPQLSTAFAVTDFTERR